MDVPSTNVATIPVQIVTPVESTYAYVFVKGRLFERHCTIFGLSSKEISLFPKSFNATNYELHLTLEAGPATIVNLLSKMGYKVISSCGENEITWTMQREI